MEEAVSGIPIAFHEGMANEQFARELWVDGPVRDGTRGHDRNAVQRDLLGSNDGTTPAVPSRLTVGVLYEVTRERLDPLGVDPSIDSAPKARRFD